MPSDPVGTPGFSLSLGTSIASAGKPQGTAAPSPSPDPTAGRFFAVGDLSDRVRRGVEVGGNKPAPVRFAVSYFVFVLGWQVPRLVVVPLASVCDFAALFLSASES